MPEAPETRTVTECPSRTLSNAARMAASCRSRPTSVGGRPRSATGRVTPHAAGVVAAPSRRRISGPVGRFSGSRSSMARQSESSSGGTPSTHSLGGIGSLSIFSVRTSTADPTNGVLPTRALVEGRRPRCTSRTQSVGVSDDACSAPCSARSRYRSRCSSERFSSMTRESPPSTPRSPG